MCTDVYRLLKDFWTGHQVILLRDDGGGTKALSVSKMEYEVLSNCVKASSAMVARIINDRTLKSTDLQSSSILAD